ncbi:MAG: sugar phosphate nucleotidyltransferase, partial [Chromatiales bacterium]|nr:sugar phosphate nucleotidyltransferase [Chromatiales bacterium]
NKNLQITKFTEKPEVPDTIPGESDKSLASMGIYIFSTHFLYSALISDAEDENSSHDFGKDIIPNAIDMFNVVAYPFINEDGKAKYWRDVGTVDSFWKSNMELCAIEPELNLYNRDWPIWTYQTQHPPAKFIFDDDGRRGEAIDSLVSGGCIISGARVKRSVLFFATRVHSFSVVKDSVLLPKVTISKNCRIRNAIIDKGVFIAEGTVIGEDAEEDARRFHVTPEGIVLVTPEMLGQSMFFSGKQDLKE